MTTEKKELWLRVFKRFVRAFIFGGISAIAVVPYAGNFDIMSLKTWGIALLVAFRTGGFLALDKLTRDLNGNKKENLYCRLLLSLIRANSTIETNMHTKTRAPKNGAEKSNLEDLLFLVEKRYVSQSIFATHNNYSSLRQQLMRSCFP